MEAKELRIGNLVSIFDGKLNAYIVREFTHMDFYMTYNDPEAMLIFEPIRITEEWLLKFGFKKVFPKRGIARAYKKQNIRINMSNMGNFYYSKTPIYFVHQLQNLYFALTGEELTCK